MKNICRKKIILITIFNLYILSSCTSTVNLIDNYYQSVFVNDDDFYIIVKGVYDNDMKEFNPGISLTKITTEGDVIKNIILEEDYSGHIYPFQNYFEVNKLYANTGTTGSIITYTFDTNSLDINSRIKALNIKHFGPNSLFFAISNDINTNMLDLDNKVNTRLTDTFKNPLNTLTTYNNYYFYSDNDNVYYIDNSGKQNILDFGDIELYRPEIISILNNKLVININNANYNFYTIDENFNISELYDLNEITKYESSSHLVFDEGRKLLVQHLVNNYSDNLQNMKLAIIDLENKKYKIIDEPFNSTAYYLPSYVDYNTDYAYISKYTSFNNFYESNPKYYNETMIIINLRTLSLVTEIDILEDGFILPRVVIPSEYIEL